MSQEMASQIPLESQFDRLTKDIEDLNITWLLLVREYSAICPEEAAIRFGLTVGACRELATTAISELKEMGRSRLLRFVPREPLSFINSDSATLQRRRSIPVLAAVAEAI